MVFVLFGGLYAVGIWREKTLPVYFFYFLWFLGLCFLLIPSQAKPVYKGWLRVAHFLGRVVTTLIMALAYYLVITPTAWIKRLFGGRPLSVKPDKKASTYWVDRTETAQPVERFMKRF